MIEKFNSIDHDTISRIAKLHNFCGYIVYNYYEEDDDEGNIKYDYGWMNSNYC